MFPAAMSLRYLLSVPCLSVCLPVMFVYVSDNQQRPPRYATQISQIHLIPLSAACFSSHSRTLLNLCASRCILAYSSAIVHGFDACKTARCALGAVSVGRRVTFVLFGWCLEDKRSAQGSMSGLYYTYTLVRSNERGLFIGYSVSVRWKATRSDTCQRTRDGLGKNESKATAGGIARMNDQEGEKQERTTSDEEVGKRKEGLFPSEHTATTATIRTRTNQARPT